MKIHLRWIFSVAVVRSVCSCLPLCLFSIASASDGRAQMRKLQDAYAAVAEKAMPAVVTVYSLSGRGVQQGVGSGFFISDDGFIVTNYHVIKLADSLAVKVADGRSVRAKLIGVSPRTDLALLKISAEDKLPYLKFADTDKVKIGHHAIAIGSPFALAQTMTTGIVSFKGRELGLHYKEDYIQTDAAINPGNSGGPLLNIDGEVIGVNDCAICSTQSNAGLGFAIDGNLARIAVLCILKRNLSPKPYAGIMMEDAGKNSPPVVTGVVKNSPAAKAGIAAGDRILKVGSRKVFSVWDVQSTILALYDPGNETVVTFLRGQKIMKTKIKLGAHK